MAVVAKLILADYAAVSEGKLNIIGAGWRHIGPGPHPYAIALMIEVPWDQGDQKHTFRLELVDADGAPVLVPTPQGIGQLAVEGEFEVARGEGKPGAPLDGVLALNIGPTPIPPGGQYEWRLQIDGRAEADWHVTFFTRPAEEAATG